MESVLLDALAVPVVGPVNRPRRTDHSVRFHMVTAAKSETRLWVLDSVCYPIAQHPLLVHSSIISPSPSHIMTDAELAVMLAEALDDFGDAPGGDGHVRDARVKEAYVSPSYSSSSSTTSSSLHHQGGRLQQRSSQPASSKWSTDDTSDVRGQHLQREQLGSLPVADHTASSYNRIITRSSTTDDRAHPSGDLVKGAAARLTCETGLCVPEHDAVGMAAISVAPSALGSDHIMNDTTYQSDLPAAQSSQRETQSGPPDQSRCRLLCNGQSHMQVPVKQAQLSPAATQVGTDVTRNIASSYNHIITRLSATDDEPPEHIMNEHIMNEHLMNEHNTNEHIMNGHIMNNTSISPAVSCLSTDWGGAHHQHQSQHQSQPWLSQQGGLTSRLLPLITHPSFTNSGKQLIAM